MAIKVTRLCQNRRSWRKKPQPALNQASQRDVPPEQKSVDRSRAHTLSETSRHAMGTHRHTTQVLGRTFLGIITKKILNTQCSN